MNLLALVMLAGLAGCGAESILSEESQEIGTARQVIAGTQSIVPGVQVVKLTCPGGKQALSGGYRGAGDLLVITESFPGDAVGDATSWYFTVNSRMSVTTQMAMYAVCALP